ncbi:hypothetical protein J5491_02140 [Candidatus Saccharibacteria bacterium]|nr:hypothetical protein [Candidatus Saccharibacteria bacterium]
MINIVHVEVHCDDKRNITAITVKVKYFKEKLEPHEFVAVVSAAFYKTTLLSDAGKSLKTQLNPKRHDVIDLIVTLKRTDMTQVDVGKFLEAFQEALDETKLF